MISSTSPRRRARPTGAPSSMTWSPTCGSMTTSSALSSTPVLDSRWLSFRVMTRVDRPLGRRKGQLGRDRAVPCRHVTSRHAALVGTTASGKSALALAVGRRDPALELVSVDSMQVYRGMDIGTAKPTPAERAEVRHHLLDIADPWDEFTVTSFAELAHDAVADIEARGRRALLVGGTGLYLRAVIDELTVPGRYPEARASVDAEHDTRALHRRLAELDPVAASRMEPTNRRRVVRALEVTIGSGRPFSSFGPGLEEYPPSRFQLIGVELPLDVVAARIETRYHEQVAAGFVEEAAGLAVRRTRRFARRQRSWFRRDPRIRWLRADEPAELLGPLLDELGIGGHEGGRQSARGHSTGLAD